MAERKTETVRIQTKQGPKEYAKVAARSAEFHKDNEQCTIETTCEFKEGHILFSAKVTTKKGTFTGHSLGKAGEQKAFEKLETISVGRALAFAGYLASGDIACAEEMEDIITETQFTSLKLKYANVYSDELEGLDREQKQQKFNSWCLSVIGEETDYRNLSSWNQDWIKLCWRELIGPDADIPFEQ